jgi:formylglycine-generating enzyme required for sulfatase activity
LDYGTVQYRGLVAGLLVCCCAVAFAADAKKDGRMVLVPAGVLCGVDPDFGEICLTNSKAFLMDKTEVTESLWMDVFDHFNAIDAKEEFIYFRSEGWTWTFDGPEKGDNYPVAGVSFRNALLWCNARSKQEGLSPCYLNEKKSEYQGIHDEPIWCDFEATGYRLPTSQEWEYAARAGECTRFPWGDTICFTNANYTGDKQANYDLSGGGLHPVFSKGVAVKVFEQATSPVMSFPPNTYGLYDMVGNVAEWCWPDNTSELKFTRYTWFILRGGSWRSEPQKLRTGNKDAMPEDDCYHGRMIFWKLLSSGFRCVRKAPDS